MAWLKVYDSMFKGLRYMVKSEVQTSVTLQPFWGPVEGQWQPLIAFAMKI